MVSVDDGGYSSEFLEVLCGLRHLHMLNLVFGNDEL